MHTLPLVTFECRLMPERRIEVTEYKCSRCSYQWISRNEKPKPRCCAKCKNREWDSVKMSREEKYLRYRLRRVTGTPKIGIFGHEYIEKNPICSKFLKGHPHPTIEELHQAIYPFGEPSDLLDLNKSDDYFEKQEELEKKKREEIMLEIINAKEKKNLKNL